jgi:phage terminase small subunit
MPRGGARPGAGRPKGSASRKSLEVANEAASSGQVLPLAFLLEVLNSPASTRAQKIRAAEVACPFVHPRLNAVAVSSQVVNVAGDGGGDVRNIVQIYAIPRGAAIDKASGRVMMEGSVVTELPTVEPFPATPPLPEEPAPARFESQPVERLEVLDVDVSNVTRLHPHEDEEPGEPGGSGAA